MKKIELQLVPHNVKIGDQCGDIEPNITEDTLFMDKGEVVGFYLKNIDGKLRSLIDLADAELLSDRVPKSDMRRSSGLRDKSAEVKQYSTILGSIPPKPHMKRPYPSMSSVHQVKSAQTFVKAMLLACREAEEVIKQISPEMYARQEEIINRCVPPKYRFGRLFTSSISNFNIAAPFHRDAGNLEGCVNVIIAKKRNAKGGNTTIPDYAATVDSSDNSMLVYPAWRNVHGVTPIRPTAPDGYRNSLVFYPLKAFNNYW
jgi:hypothetical protein